MLLRFLRLEHNLLLVSFQFQHRGLLQGQFLLLVTLQGHRGQSHLAQYHQWVLMFHQQSLLVHLLLQEASRAMDHLLVCQVHCMEDIMVVSMKVTRTTEHLILLANTHHHPVTPGHSSIITE